MGSEHAPGLVALLVGAVVLVTLLAKAALDRARLPPLIAHLLVGVALRGADERWALLPADAFAVFDFLGQLGVIVLLFGVGVQSELQHLRRQLRRASVMWAGNIVISGGLGYAAAAWLGLGWIPSLVVAVALSATSVGVPAAVWERSGAIDSGEGQLFVDVAELDDVSGVVLMAILFAVLPELHELAATGGDEPVATPWGSIAASAGGVLAMLAAFVAACYLFARYAAEPVTRALQRFEDGTDTIVSVTGIGVVLAGLAAALGFTVAVGAFFAGLAFSRQRESIAGTQAHATLRDLFVPFFFVDVGLSVTLDSLGAAGSLAVALPLVAVLGKILGTSLPGLLVVDGRGALLLGVAMVPRAEISMLVMERGRELGDWAVSGRVFSAMVGVVLVTCLVAPPALQWLLARQGLGRRARRDR